jgi:hypothetical protein
MSEHEQESPPTVRGVAGLNEDKNLKIPDVRNFELTC